MTPLTTYGDEEVGKNIYEYQSWVGGRLDQSKMLSLARTLPDCLMRVPTSWWQLRGFPSETNELVTCLIVPQQMTNLAAVQQQGMTGTLNILVLSWASRI